MKYVNFRPNFDLTNLMDLEILSAPTFIICRIIYPCLCRPRSRSHCDHSLALYSDITERARVSSTYFTSTDVSRRSFGQIGTNGSTLSLSLPHIRREISLTTPPQAQGDPLRQSVSATTFIVPQCQNYSDTLFCHWSQSQYYQ